MSDSDSNPFEGLFPGDYFIQRMDFDGDIIHAYGFLQGEDHAGRLHAHYQCRRPPSRPASIAGESMKVVGRISQAAYKLAKLRGWPDDDAGVLSIIAFSGGRPGEATFLERVRIMFLKP